MARAPADALPMLRTIAVSGDRVSLAFDWMGASRTVRLDLPEHHAVSRPRCRVIPSAVGKATRSSWIRWDFCLMRRVPVWRAIGRRQRLVERLALPADRTRLDYEFTVQDSFSLTEPVTYRMQWVHRPDLEPTGDACDETIATRFLRE